MDTLIRVVLYVAIGIALLVANLWFVNSVRNAVVGRKIVIAPFQIIGREDDDGKLGLALARMLQSQLTKIQQDTEASQRALIQASGIPQQDDPIANYGTSISILPPQSLRAVSIPTDLLEPINFNVEVSGIELSGFFVWAQRRLVKEQTLNFTVYFEGERAIVSGNPEAFGISSGEAIWLETKTSPDEITTDLAYTLIKMGLSEDQASEINALTLEEFRTLLKILKEAADLNRNVELGRSARDGFQALLPQTELLIGKMPEWYALNRLTADMAESAENYERAIYYYQQLDRLGGAEGRDTAWLNTKIKNLIERFGVEIPGEAVVTLIRNDMTDAVDSLNKLFDIDLDVPELELLEDTYKNAYWSSDKYYAPPQVQYLPDVTYHVLSHGFINEVTPFEHSGQSGAISESYADILATLIKQERLGQTAELADWIIAPGGIAWTKGEDIVYAEDRSPLRSLSAPGTAYDDPVLGKDSQVAHMKDYKDASYDSGGVHINSGIPNKAFYEVAIRVGSDMAGEIWLKALHELSPTSDFQSLAKYTFEIAGNLYGDNGEEQEAVRKAWETVGISL